MKRKRSYRLEWAKHQQRWFGKWHAYLGIIAGLVIAIVALTGSILVFQDEIDAALNRQFFEVKTAQRRIPLEEIIPVIQKKYPSLAFSYAMDETGAPNKAYRFYDFVTEQEIFINPYTATISGKRLYESSFIRVVTAIHTSLLVPKIGEYITGLSALVLLVLTISGLRLWIPQKWKQLKSVLTVKFSVRFKRQNYDWHNVIGFYSSPVVAFLALTGFCITFSVIVVPMLFILSGKSPKGIEQIFDTHSSYTKNAVMLSPQQAAAIAYQQMPGNRVGDIILPADSAGTYQFDMVAQGPPEDGKRELLIIDQYNGKVLLNSRLDFPQVGNAYLAWLTPLHYGSFGGMPTKILACLGGLAPLALFVTGFIIWYPRWRRQNKVAGNDMTEEKELPAKRLEHAVTTNRIAAFTYFIKQLQYGCRYAGWTLLVTIAMGVLYGVFSGIVLEPAVFGVAFTTVLVAINFAVALLCFLFNAIFLAPFKKGCGMLVRYFSLSLAFCAVFLASYFLLMNTGMHIF